MHKRIGILGGMSPESTTTYYEYMTRTYTERYGDFGYPEILIYSLVSEADAGVPLLDTTTLHAEAALTYACQTD